LVVCLYFYINIYICNMLASKVKTEPNFKNLKTQNTLYLMLVVLSPKILESAETLGRALGGSKMKKVM
jgi:hypothetical protein